MSETVTTYQILTVTEGRATHEFSIGPHGGRHTITHYDGSTSTHMMVPTETMLVKLILELKNTNPTNK